MHDMDPHCEPDLTTQETGCTARVGAVRDNGLAGLAQHTHTRTHTHLLCSLGVVVLHMRVAGTMEVRLQLK